MTKEELQERSLTFAVSVRPFAKQVMAVVDLQETGQQLINSSASMASNYRAACRARSRAEFISKLGTVNEARKLPTQPHGRKINPQIATSPNPANHQIAKSQIPKSA